MKFRLLSLILFTYLLLRVCLSQDCSEPKDNACKNKGVANCLTYEFDSASKKCVDCSQSIDSKCTNEGVANCFRYKFDSSNNKCVDYCTETKDNACLNSALAFCQTYVFDPDNKNCIDCSKTDENICNLKCKEDFIYKNECKFNCNTTTSSCKKSQLCVSFEYDILSQTCIDCTTLTQQNCKYDNPNICTTYVFNNNMCKNCSESKDGKCTNQSISECSGYKFDGSSKCYNCEAAYKNQCVYSRVTNCSNYQYNKSTQKCFDCIDANIVWDDSKCEACKSSTQETIKNPNENKCQKPSDQIKAYSSIILPCLFILQLYTLLI